MILDWLKDWFKELLIDGIISNLSGLFDTVNQKVGEVAGEVGATPQGWNAGIFNMIRSLSETVIIPIAGAVLAFVMTYEPVSYTHLDVYKRQTLPSTRMIRTARKRSFCRNRRSLWAKSQT